ncbi:CYTH domain-containing protein [Candidatus Berkelbacteria bacterium]|nr:CYTH domain-containing protein [Candidatus Berkelbacteria bacterium]
MVEVEIRGELTKEQSEELKQLLSQRGKHIRTQDREMILLRDYPGYDKDPTRRHADIRIRRTNGQSEIMLKYKAGEGNVGRHEISLPLEGDSFEQAKAIAAGFGCTHGLWVHRISEIYEHSGIEWAIVEALTRDGEVRKTYYEAEAAAKSEADVPHVREQLMIAAGQFKVPVLETDEAMRDFIYELDRAVNEEITLGEPFHLSSGKGVGGKYG